MEPSCYELYTSAVEASRSEQHEHAMKLLDQCICSGPIPDRAIWAYYGLFEELWNGFARHQHERNSIWTKMAAECNARVIAIYNLYPRKGWKFGDFASEIFERSRNNQGRFGLDSTPAVPALATSTLKCLRTPWQDLEIFIPENWDGFSGSDENFPILLIGKDKGGNPIGYTCNPAQLQNSQNNPPGAPAHLTETYFRLDVLKDILANEEKFEVLRRGDAGLIRSKGERWQIEIFFETDDNHRDIAVVARLGDIGMCVPWEIRKHFQKHNFAPESAPVVLASF